MQTNELIEYFRVRVKKFKEHKIMSLDDLITYEKILDAADRLEELESECKSLAESVVSASDILRKRNEKLKDTEKIAEFYHRELEKKCEELAKAKPKTNKRERLKRCPFCGGKARIMKCPVGMYSGLYIVGCDKDDLCFGNINHITMIFPSKELAEKTWNRRAEK